jgi:hypothetical protein
MINKAGKYDVAVAYRIYPKMAKPAIGLPFCDNKERMAEICVQSFQQSLGTLRAKIWVLLDGCPPQYEDIFRKYFANEDLVLIRLPGVGNQATFERQIEILLGQEDAEIVYFAEDDYFYLPGKFRLMTEFLRSASDVDFISPFDHMDCYTLDLHHKRTWLRVFGNRHWRTAASTCLTFLTTKSTLRSTQRIFRSYSRWRNYDASLWLSLTKENVAHPVNFLRWAGKQSFLVKVIAKTWIFGWSQILFGKRYKLWSPVPGIATHLDFKALSPTIDWPELMQQQALQLAGSNKKPLS